MDDDEGMFGQLLFRLSDLGSQPFEIETQSSGVGIIRNTEPLNFESAESYSLTVIVEDLGPTPRTDTATVNITVINLNDNPPMFVGAQGQPVDTINSQVSEELMFPFTVLVLQVCNL